MPTDNETWITRTTNRVGVIELNLVEFNKLTPQEQSFIIRHETMHAAMSVLWPVRRMDAFEPLKTE